MHTNDQRAAQDKKKNEFGQIFKDEEKKENLQYTQKNSKMHLIFTFYSKIIYV